MKHFVIALCLISNAAFAAEGLSDQDDAKALVEAVMKDVGAGKVTEGVSRLRAHSVVSAQEFDTQMAKFKTRFPQIIEQFGNPVGYDFVEAVERGETLVQYVYLQKLEKHPMVWRFLFYKPAEAWLVNTWYLDHKLSPLFDD